MEAMPALRRADGASGSQGASDARRSAPQQAPERPGAWQRPGRFRGRSQNVGRSLGIGGVRALARALSLSLAHLKPWHMLAYCRASPSPFLRTQYVQQKGRRCSALQLSNDETGHQSC